MVRRAGTAVVRLYGEVDAFTVPVLETALLTELDARPELLVVDLAGVTWFGVSSLIPPVADRSSGMQHDLGPAVSRLSKCW